MLKIKIKKLNDKAVIPTKAHDTDAAYDLTATSVELLPNGALCYGTGIALEIPKGYAGFIYPRSSIRNTLLTMANSVGVIDSGYRGELKVTFYVPLHYTLKGLIKAMFGRSLNYNDDYYSEAKLYKVGDRIGQLIIRTAPSVQFVEASVLKDSERGAGGHGSTGK